jgi:hypothetical protein
MKELMVRGDEGAKRANRGSEGFELVDPHAVGLERTLKVRKAKAELVEERRVHRVIDPRSNLHDRCVESLLP